MTNNMSENEVGNIKIRLFKRPCSNYFDTSQKPDDTPPLETEEDASKNKKDKD